MASSSEAPDNKTVTGYPAPPVQVATGYPAPNASATTTNIAYAFSFRPLRTASSVYRPVEPTSYNYPIRPNFLHRLCFFFIVVSSLMALLIFTFYLVLRPHLPEFRVDSATVSQLNLTKSELTANWFFTLHVKNPNKKLSIHYDRLEASVFYGEKLGLATTQLPPFIQDRNNESSVKFQLAVISEYVSDDVVQKISNGKDRGSLDFGVRVFSWVRFTSGVWRMGEHMLRVYCDPVRIGYRGINGTGSSMDQSKKCDVYLN